MNDNNTNGDADALPSAAPQSLLDRVRNTSGLLLAALALIPVAAFVAYAVFSSAREKTLMEAGGQMEAALLAYESGDMDGSLEILGEVRERFESVKTARTAEYYEGAILFAKEEDELSLERMSGFLSDSEDKILRREALFMAGFSSFRLGRWIDAIRYLEELFVESPAHRRRVLPILATAYGKNGDKERADQLLRQFATTLPDPAAEEIEEVSEVPPETSEDVPQTPESEISETPQETTN